MSNIDEQIEDMRIPEQLVGAFPAQRYDKLLLKFQQTLALTKVVKNSFQEIRRESLALGVEWSSNVESLLAHLEIDLDWLQKEFKQIRG